MTSPSSIPPPDRDGTRRRAIAAAGAWAVLLAAAPVHAATPVGPLPASPGEPVSLPVLSGTVGRIDTARSVVEIESVPYAFAAGLPTVPGDRAGRPVVLRSGMRVRFQSMLADGRQRLVALSEVAR